MRTVGLQQQQQLPSLPQQMNNNCQNIPIQMNMSKQRAQTPLFNSEWKRALPILSERRMKTTSEIENNSPVYAHHRDAFTEQKRRLNESTENTIGSTATPSFNRFDQIRCPPINNSDAENSNSCNRSRQYSETMHSLHLKLIEKKAKMAQQNLLLDDDEPTTQESNVIRRYKQRVKHKMQQERGTQNFAHQLHNRIYSIAEASVSSLKDKQDYYSQLQQQQQQEMKQGKCTRVDGAFAPQNNSNAATPPKIQESQKIEFARSHSSHSPPPLPSVFNSHQIRKYFNPTWMFILAHPPHFLIDMKAALTTTTPRRQQPSPSTSPSLRTPSLPKQPLLIKTVQTLRSPPNKSKSSKFIQRSNSSSANKSPQQKVKQIFFDSTEIFAAESTSPLLYAGKPLCRRANSALHVKKSLLLAPHSPAKATQ